ncbi:hypothetical protein MN116_005327 [Schistosoma mekongi]|uniref:Transient receptor potential cation channel subfamily M member 3 n=1 Tax=Schistosoma mekongi TaxID=38744 RepID=A0AAE1ZDM9_SCHME|nr:hypothetical protein MN116_005327 [Schistosoma mekongi]
MFEKSKGDSKTLSRYEEHVRDLKEKKHSFILKHFTFKECIRFVPDPQYTTETSQSDRCYCGEYRIYHYFHGQKPMEAEEKEWSDASCLKIIGPTNAFGQIEFITESTSNLRPTEFVRISDEDKLEDVMTLMKKYWKMMEPAKPSLCISVIGGAKNFVLEGHKKEVFYSGLVQAAQTTKAWIVTSGLNLGIIRVVGDALQEQAFCTDKRMLSQQLRCIGIAPWGYVLNRNTLVAKECEDHIHPLPYTVSTVIETGQPVSLNQNHSHYIFVDEGKRLRYGGSESARFRAKLEKQIALPEENGGFGIPVVLVVVEGGHDVFIDARNSIKERVPVVICSGTGRAADILDMAFNFRLKNAQFTSFTEKEMAILSHKLKPVSGKNKIEAALKMIQFIVQDTKLITTFDMNKSDDLDLAILYALIKTSSELDKQLELALTWDRSDIAEAKIFRQGKQVNPEILEPIMMKALLKNKTDFVRILLQNGVVMRQFLTFERLHCLYNKSTQPADLIRCLKNYKLLHSKHSTLTNPQLHLSVTVNDVMSTEVERSFTYPCRIYLSTICKLLRRMLGRYTNRIYDMDTVVKVLTFDITYLFLFKELFIWAVLFQRQKMALYFWERSEDAIILALIACCLYSDMSRLLPTYDTEGKMVYESYVEEFETLAIRVLEECNEIDPEYTLYLIEGESLLWGGFNCLQLAAQSVRRKFISSQACQNSLDFAWCHGIRANMFIMFVTLILPFLLCFDRILSWEDKHSHVNVDYGYEKGTESFENTKDVLDKENNLQKHRSRSLHVHRNFAERIKMFYTAPKTKFCLYTMVYVIFLTFFSYTLLFNTRPSEITIHEGFIMAYFIAMIIDIIRQILVSPGVGHGKVTSWWVQYEWGRSELFVILLALVSMFLRIGLDSTFIYAKSFYILTLITCYIRIYGLYSYHPNLGPKLVMIRSMLEELISFIFILIVVFLAYGISLHVLLYPYRREFTWNDVRDVLYYPYWNLYGELSLDYAFANNVSCGSNPDGITCPIYHFLCPLFLAVYLMIAGTLLINLLIAIFSNVFEQIQYHSIELWKFNMFSMVVEFNKKPIVPVPLSAVQAFIELILHCIRMSKVNKRNVKNYRFAASANLQPLVENEAENEKDDGAKLFKFTERNNQRPRLGSMISFSQLSPRPSESSIIDTAIPESLQHNLEHGGEDNEDALRRVRVLEANCKRNFLRKKKLDRGKTIEAGIGQLKDRLEEIYSNLINVGEKVESLTRDIEFFNAANEIKSTERSNESTRKNVPLITDSQEPHSEKLAAPTNDETSKQQPTEISKLSPVEYPEISSESEIEYALDVSEPPIDVLPIFDQFEKSHQTKPLQNILLNL